VETDAFNVVAGGIKLKEFYDALFDFVKKAKESRDDGQPARTMMGESRRRILERISDGDLEEEIDDLLKNVSFLFTDEAIKMPKATERC
jgi:hypothetical protein